MKTDTLPPTVRCLALITRMRVAIGCMFPLSLGLLDRWTRNEIAERNAAASAALAISEPIKRSQRLIDQALENDPPSLRNKILEALAEEQRNCARLSEGLRVQVPPSLAESVSV